MEFCLFLKLIETIDADNFVGQILKASVCEEIIRRKIKTKMFKFFFKMHSRFCELTNFMFCFTGPFV